MTATTTPAVVAASKLGLTFQTNDGPVNALSDVELTIGKGEFVSFIGPSGCGKTTFLRVSADLEKPTSGTILVNGMTAEQAREKRAYGYVFQAAALLPWRSIERNVALPLEIMGISKAEQRERDFKKAMRKLQDSLGELRDLAMASALLERFEVPEQSRPALPSRAQLLKRAMRQLEQVLDCKPYWT